MRKLSVTERRVSEDEIETIIVEVNENETIVRTVATVSDPEYAYIFAAAPEMLSSLKDFLELFVSATQMTDTYCDICQAHARKHTNQIGDWTGKVDPIIHASGCIVGKAEILIAIGEEVKA